MSQIFREVIKNKKYFRIGAMFLALFLLCAIFHAMTNGAFFEPRNISNLLRQMVVTGILSIGMMFIIVAGFIDLSVGSVVCFLGVVMAMLLERQVAPSLSLLVMLISALVIAFLNGFLISQIKIPAFIVSLGGMLFYRGAALGLTKGSTIPLGDNWLGRLSSSFVPGWVCLSIFAIYWLVQLGLKFKTFAAQKKSQSSAETSNIFIAKQIALLVFLLGAGKLLDFGEGVSVPILILFGLFILFDLVSKKTVFGRRIFAIGSNPDASYLSGINIKKISCLVFVMGGALSALAAAILTSRVGSASPDAGQLLELDAIAACVIGGTSLSGGVGSVSGALFGALLMEVLNNGMSLANLDAYWQYIVKGVVLVLAVGLDVTSQKHQRSV